MKFLAVLLLLAMIPMAHADPAPLTIGDTTIQFPSEAGYVRASSADPKFFAFVQAALPTTNRLVEVFITPADLDRLHTTGIANGPYYEVQVMREMETRPIGIDEWNENKPQLTAGMTKLDMNALAAKDTDSSARMSAAAGQSVSRSFGQMGAPAIFRETPMSVEYGVLVPMQMNSGGQTVSTTIAVAGAFAVVRNRLIFIYAYSTSTSDAAIADLHARLDALVDQTMSLNPNDPSVSTSWGLFHGVGRAAVIGAVIGLLIGFFAWLIGRIRKSPKA